jgi:hypothetical protein
LSEYASCQLTKRSDKLVAISGVARYMKSIVKDVYVAGFWLKFLASELFWSCLDRTNCIAETVAQRESSLMYHSPSFSWASADRRFTRGDPFDYGDVLPKVQFIKYRSDPDEHVTSPRLGLWTEDVFGPLSSPLVELEIIGTLKKVALRYIRHSGGFYAEIFQESVPPPWSTIKQSLSWARLDNTVAQSEVSAMEDKTFYCMLWIDNGKKLDSMLLELEDDHFGHFRRIGILYAGKQEREDLLACQDGEESFPCWRYDKTTRMHTIYLV